MSVGETVQVPTMTILEDFFYGESSELDAKVRAIFFNFLTAMGLQTTTYGMLTSECEHVGMFRCASD